AADGIRDRDVTGVQTCALPICGHPCLGHGPPLLRQARLPGPAGTAGGAQRGDPGQLCDGKSADGRSVKFLPTFGPGPCLWAKVILYWKQPINRDWSDLLCVSTTSLQRSGTAASTPAPSWRP